MPETNPTPLYVVDNGAIVCPAHMGATARHTRRTLEGEPVVLVTRAWAVAWEEAVGAPPECETCAAIGGAR